MEETKRLEKSKEETGGTVHTGSVSTAKTEILRFRVTPEERVKIERRALCSYRTISRYLRDCALGKEIVVVPGTDSVAEELRRIGNNLNQIARAVNSGGVHAVDLSGNIGRGEKSMAVVKFVASGCPMNNIAAYVMRGEATERKLIDGILCSPESVLEEFRFVKEKFHKEEGRQYYHIIQSFSPEDRLTPETAHEIGMRFAEYFGGYQALVATHTNKDHLHNHIILNSVNMETGYKYHQSRDEMLKAKRFSNDLCREYGLSVTEEKCEYGRTPQWKDYLKAFIEYTLGTSPDRETFIRKMKNHGYGVKWEDGHKYVTFTTPEGYKCRDNKLFDERFLRCNMEIYFAMGGRCSPAAEEYLGYETPRHDRHTNMTAGNELIFLMADIFSDHRKKTKEEIEAEENARDIATGMGIFIGVVLLMAERYRQDYTDNPEEFGLRPRGYDVWPQLIM